MVEHSIHSVCRSFGVVKFPELLSGDFPLVTSGGNVMMGGLLPLPVDASVPWPLPISNLTFPTGWDSDSEITFLFDTFCYSAITERINHMWDLTRFGVQ